MFTVNWKDTTVVTAIIAAIGAILVALIGRMGTCRAPSMASNYGNLGIVYKTRGDLDKARESWAKARDLFEQLGARHMVEKVQGWLDGLRPDGI